MTRPRLIVTCAAAAIATLLLLVGTALALRDSPPDLGPAIMVDRGTSAPTGSPSETPQPSAERSSQQPGASPVQPATPPGAGDDDDDDDAGDDDDD